MRNRSIAAASTVLTMAAMAGGSSVAAEADGVACALTTPTLARLGFARMPPSLSPQERRTFEEAGRALHKGRLLEARAALQGLAGKIPDAGEVRYRLATAQAMAGDLHSACGEIARLLELDFVGFAKRFENDKAFSSLRDSGAGRQLREHSRAVEALWRQAIQTGLPALMSRGARGPMDIWRPSFLRGGVYVHEAQRFLPVEPGVDGASAELVDPKDGRVSVLKATVSACHDRFCPRFSKAEVMVFSLEDLRRTPVRWHMDEQGATTTAIDLRSGSLGAAVRIHDCCCWKGCTSPWTNIGPKSGAPARESAALDMAVDFRGTLLGVVPAGLRVGKGHLMVDGAAEIPLAPEHEPGAVQDILVDDRTGARLVFTAVDRCACSTKNEGPILRYAISTIDGKTGKVTTVEHDEGTGAAMLDGKQAVYVQTGTTLRRWPSISAVGTESGLPILPGVVLVVPRSPSGNCCGL